MLVNNVFWILEHEHIFKLLRCNVATFSIFRLQHFQTDQNALEMGADIIEISVVSLAQVKLFRGGGGDQTSTNYKYFNSIR